MPVKLWKVSAGGSSHEDLTRYPKYAHIYDFLHSTRQQFLTYPQWRRPFLKLAQSLHDSREEFPGGQGHSRPVSRPTDADVLPFFEKFWPKVECRALNNHRNSAAPLGSGFVWSSSSSVNHNVINLEPGLLDSWVKLKARDPEADDVHFRVVFLILILHELGQRFASWFARGSIQSRFLRRAEDDFLGSLSVEGWYLEGRSDSDYSHLEDVALISRDGAMYRANSENMRGTLDFAHLKGNLPLLSLSPFAVPVGDEHFQRVKILPS